MHPDAYRKAVGRFATGVTVVTTTVRGGSAALTANSFTSVSLDPVLLLVCVQKSARFHALVLEAGVWGVSVLAADMEEISTRFASPVRYELDRPFEGLKHSAGAVTGCPLLDDALATFECRTVLAYEGGDHTMLLGEVLTLATPRSDVPPLVFFDGTYRSLT